MNEQSLLSPVNGWLILDKPRDIGSTPALAAARRLFSQLAGQKVKAGHAGTLDPFAEGVLPIAFGEATKTIAFAQDRRKTYRFTVRWGVATDTEDLTGQVVAESVLRPSEAQILAALPTFTGKIMQRPPIYSALHIGGVRAHELARQGEAPDMAARPVEIESLHLIEIIDENSTSLEVVCGKGTYVRSLARDLGLALGTCAHVTRLVRMIVGPFRQEHAFSLEKLRDLAHKGELVKALLPLDFALDDIPGISCDSGQAQRLRQGQSILAQSGPPDEPQGSPALARSANTGQPIGIVERQGDEWHPARVFNLMT